VTDLRDTLDSEISGSYIIERELGGGGMSRVFLATEKNLDRQVVIKVLPEDVAAGISADRFRREIQLVAKCWAGRTLRCRSSKASRCARDWIERVICLFPTQ
jgi:serine/threonine protein kinase